MATMLDDYWNMDVRGGDAWNGLKRLNATALVVGGVLFGVIGAGAVLAKKIVNYKRRWNEIDLQEKKDIVKALRRLTAGGRWTLVIFKYL